MPVARAKDMSPPLHSGFGCGAGQRLEFFLIPLYLTGLRHLIDEVRHEQREPLLLLTLQERITNLIALGGKISIRRLLVFKNLKHSGVATARDRTADLTRLHGKGN